MIKANELRIGNWVLEAGEFSNIYQIERGGSSMYRINDIPYNRQTGCTVNGGEDRLQPIPLTPEILEKAGFDKTGYKKVDEFAVIFINLERKEFTLCSSEAPTSSYGYWGGGLEYLHQLQNLYFALTGEELTVNFKELTYQ